MCLPVDWDIRTREERLLDDRAVRAHHRELYEGYLHNRPGGVDAWKAHAAEHRLVALRLRQAHLQKSRIK